MYVVCEKFLLIIEIYWNIVSTSLSLGDTTTVKGGAFEGYSDSPFGYGRGEGADQGRGEKEWIVAQERYDYDDVFDTLNPIDGKITGSNAKEMVKSKRPNAVLRKTWKLADVDKDGMLDSDCEQDNEIFSLLFLSNCCRFICVSSKFIVS